MAIYHSYRQWPSMELNPTSTVDSLVRVNLAIHCFQSIAISFASIVGYPA
jgi:hypothetical protein